jgi:hypothetical protein
MIKALEKKEIKIEALKQEKIRNLCSFTAALAENSATSWSTIFSINLTIRYSSCRSRPEVPV